MAGEVTLSTLSEIASAKYNSNTCKNLDAHSHTLGFCFLEITTTSLTFLVAIKKQLNIDILER